VTDYGNILGRKPDLRHKRERTITAPIGKEPVDRASVNILPEMVSDLHRRLNGVAGKIEKLQDEIKETAKDSIPVHEKAYEVKQALRTLFPDRPSTHIFFDEYIQALEYGYRRSNINLDVVVNITSGNAELDGRLLNEQQFILGDDIDPKELAMIAGQFMLLYVANKISSPHSSTDMAKVAAPKIYPGTEQAPSRIQYIIGLAALLLQIAENKEEVKDLLKETIASDPGLSDLTADDAIALAEEQGGDDLISRYQNINRPYYWDAIVRYSQDFMTNNTEPGYEGWQSYDILEGDKADVKQSIAEFDHYGRKVEEVEQAAFSMSKDIYRSMVYKAHAVNQRVDRLASILSSKLTADLLCCLVLFVGALPTQQLKLLKFSLTSGARGFSVDLGSAMSGMQNRVHSFMAESILEPIMHQVDRFFTKYKNDALAMVDKSQWPDPELYDIVMACAPVDQMIEYALDGLLRLQKKLKELIQKVWNRIEVKGYKGNLSLRLLGDSKQCRVILDVLNQILEAIERGNLCAREGDNMPNPEEVEDFVNRVSQGLPTPVKLPVGDDPWETFKLEEFTTSLGLPIQPSEGPGVDGSKRFRMEDCLRRNASPQQILKAMGLSIQLSRDLRNASSTIGSSRPNP